MDYEVEGVIPRGCRPKKTWSEVTEKDCYYYHCY